jgi:hypothetical protein
MADAVQTRIEREVRFASDVSHELRSPITALSAAVEVLDARRTELPERTRQALDVVVSQVRRFDDMVIDLLELSRIDAGATDLHTETVDLAELCDRVTHRFGYGGLPSTSIAALSVSPSSTASGSNASSATCWRTRRPYGGGPLRISIEPGGARLCSWRSRTTGPAWHERTDANLRAVRARQRGRGRGSAPGSAGARRRTCPCARRRGVGRRNGRRSGARFVVRLPAEVDR